MLAKFFKAKRCIIYTDVEGVYTTDPKKLNKAKKNALVMHPGPINRGIEIDSDVADDIGRSLILEQVKLGVAVRMSVINKLINKWKYRNIFWWYTRPRISLWSN